jgi:hypothetical protein
MFQDERIDSFDNYVTCLILVLGSRIMRARLPGQNKIWDVIIERVYLEQSLNLHEFVVAVNI